MSPLNALFYTFTPRIPIYLRKIGLNDTLVEQMKTIRTSEVKLLEHYNWVPDTIKAFTKLAFLVQTGFLSFKAFQIVSIH